MATPQQLSTQFLVQFLAAVTRCSDVDAAAAVAADRTAAIFEAEVAAVVIGDSVNAVGFPRGQVPVGALRSIASRGTDRVTVPGVGSCLAIIAPLGEGSGGHLLVARSGAGGFSPEEFSLLRGMGRTLALVLVMLRTVDAERSLRERSEAQATENAALLTSLQGRHHLLEQLMTIQRSISRRAPLDQVLNSIVSGAHEILSRDEIACLCLLAGGALAASLHLTTSRGLPTQPGAARLVSEATRRLSARAIAADRVVIGDPVDENAAGTGAACLRSAMAAPVHENGQAVGALVVGSVSTIRSYTAAEEATLAAYAEHVSLAITDARTLEDMRQAHHDPLTGLASRRLFMERLREALLHAARAGTSVSLLFLDLDRFKMVNDTRGHRAGDLLLAEVANRLRSCVRADNSSARLGGDEFAVLLQGTEQPEHPVMMAQRILDSLRRPVLLEGQQLFIDASIGLVTARAGSLDADALVRDADVAMYEAKRTGAGRTAVFEPQMRVRFRQRVELEADLREALTSRQLRLNYQPILDLNSGVVSCVEALLRWAHPSRGEVPPMSFIPMAEETGLILPVGDFVLREACRQAGEWRALPGSDATSISVNLSGRQLQEPDIALLVASALAAADLDASCLVLEITESMLVNDDRGMLRRLHELKDLGVRLAIDDFGAGYSSLSYLRSFPIDILKVDKSFVDLIAKDADAASLARAVIGLGRTLHLQTVAEGIESAAQSRILREAHCDLGQGYFFARPLEAEAIQAYLASARPFSRLSA